MMEWLAEDPLPIWVGGAVALTMALIVYFQTGSNKALAAVGAVIALTASLLLAEWLIETPREAVERSLYELAAAVEANDIPTALSYLAPSTNGQLRDAIETLMPLVEIERARVIGTPLIEPVPGEDAYRVTVRGFIVATIKQSGIKGAENDEVTLTFVRIGDRWLIDDFASKRKWHRALGR